MGSVSLWYSFFFPLFIYVYGKITPEKRRVGNWNVITSERGKRPGRDMDLPSASEEGVLFLESVFCNELILSNARCAVLTRQKNRPAVEYIYISMRGIPPGYTSAHTAEPKPETIIKQRSFPGKTTSETRSNSSNWTTFIPLMPQRFANNYNESWHVLLAVFLA